jgi:hypothetical protein
MPSTQSCCHRNLFCYTYRFVHEGLLAVGKDLSAIATMLGFKTKADVVEFYYNWKNQNESYKHWVEHRKLVCINTSIDWITFVNLLFQVHWVLVNLMVNYTISYRIATVQRSNTVVYFHGSLLWRLEYYWPQLLWVFFACTYIVCSMLLLLVSFTDECRRHIPRQLSWDMQWM